MSNKRMRELEVCVWNGRFVCRTASVRYKHSDAYLIDALTEMFIECVTESFGADAVAEYRQCLHDERDAEVRELQRRDEEIT